MVSTQAAPTQIRNTLGDGMQQYRQMLENLSDSMQIAAGQPADPAATVSSTAIMGGLAIAFTPQKTGRVVAFYAAFLKNAANGDGVTASLNYGTGTAPVQGAATTGTLISPSLTFTALTGNLTEHVTLMGMATLTPRTAYWFDIAYQQVTGNTASVLNGSYLVYEF